MKKQSAQQIIDECEGLYTYWKVECGKCGNILAVTNHKMKAGDIAYAGDVIPTKYLRGNVRDGQEIKCQCNGLVYYNSLGGIGRQITEEEYKKIKKEIC